MKKRIVKQSLNLDEVEVKDLGSSIAETVKSTHEFFTKKQDENCSMLYSPNSVARKKVAVLEKYVLVREMDQWIARSKVVLKRHVQHVVDGEC